LRAILNKVEEKKPYLLEQEAKDCYMIDISTRGRCRGNNKRLLHWLFYNRNVDPPVLAEGDEQRENYRIFMAECCISELEESSY